MKLVFWSLVVQLLIIIKLIQSILAVKYLLRMYCFLTCQHQVCQPIYLSIYLYLFIYLSIYLFIYLSNYSISYFDWTLYLACWKDKFSYRSSDNTKVFSIRFIIIIIILYFQLFRVNTIWSTNHTTYDNKNHVSQSSLLVSL